jgi:hypothetical protein
MKSLSAGETDVCRLDTKITQCADIGLGCIGLQSSKHLEDRTNVVFIFPFAHFHALQGGHGAHGARWLDAIANSTAYIRSNPYSRTETQ